MLVKVRELEFIIDDADAPLIQGMSFWIDKEQGHHKTSYVRSYVNGKKIRLHRFLLGVTDPNVFIDHINGNGLDNRRSNLRICTQAENERNKPKTKRNSTGYKGVYRYGKRFEARIGVSGVYIRLGTYDTAEEAAQAYADGAAQYHGEFANATPLPRRDSSPDVALPIPGTDGGQGESLVSLT